MEPTETPEQLILTDEKIGFDPEHLIACEKCRRTNAPNRLRCIYCNAALNIPESARGTVRIDAARPEIWENGVNVICMKTSPASVDLTEAAHSAGIEAEFLRNVLAKALPLPAARVHSGEEGELIIERLAHAGIETAIIADQDLRAPVRRLRAAEITEDELVVILFNSDDVVRIGLDDIEVIVFGRILENEVTSTEIRKLRGAEVDDQVVAKSRSGMIDIHTAFDSFRIQERGFDFSCLGREKSYIAAENIVRFAEVLHANAPSAVFDDRYDELRELLEPVWGMEEIQEAGGVSRTGMGKLLVTRTTRQTNLDQFNKYSQMRRRLS